MYFWRIEQLKGELSRGVLAQRAAFSYVFSTLLLYTVLTGMPGLWNTDPTPPLAPDWVAYAASVLLVAGGTYLCYRANGGRRGIDFPSRYFAIGWVLMIRLMVLLCVPLFLLIFFVVLPGTEPTDAEMAWLGGGTALVFEGVYYWRLWWHIKAIAVPSSSAA